MRATKRTVAVLSAFAAALLFAGCAAAPKAESPTASPSPTEGSGDHDIDEMAGALLDNGRMFVVTTQGSSTCIPQVKSATAKGQTVAVTLVDPASDSVCTMDLVPRASAGELPSGVDPTKDVTLQVTYGDRVGTIEIDGTSITGTPGTPTDNKPSASWIDDDTLVLLTWGSSGCPPVVESLSGSGNSGTVTFVTDKTKVCTADMAPRVTLITFDKGSVDDDGAFTLKLVGDNLDGTVEVAAS
ncbi:hypothetical protein G7068_09125 [Leucobacter viscericola]|uniref:Uncharacterized protein n=1 Tax=Leucobacter viscericola TaxID=2714935 RepID=A0A6G7XFL7_9MICO|nr:hypothetical protein [Leucobacter viscericola]QIK63343.1 hypothetical protein G7068_09125 [Leucobacter viscericola]